MDADKFKFRVQRRIAVTAHDQKTGAKFLLSEGWHTIGGCHYLEDAEWLAQKARRDRPRATFRIVEGARVVKEWGRKKLGGAPMPTAVNYPLNGAKLKRPAVN